MHEWKFLFFFDIINPRKNKGIKIPSTKLKLPNFEHPEIKTPQSCHVHKVWTWGRRKGAPAVV